MITPPEIDLVSLAPVLVLTAFTIIVMLTDLFIGKNKSGLVFIALTGLLMTAVASFAKSDWPVTSFGGMYVVDHMSVFFTIIFCISSALAILVSVDYNKRENIHVGEYYSLILFCTIGMIILASATDLIMIFLGIEIISLCLYVLAGIRRGDTRSNEAALKYFLLGAFATGFLLYGMTLLYGSTGTTKLAGIAEALSKGEHPLALMGGILLVVGFGFKVASVPFHMWAPDVYEGAPTPVTAFMAVGPKAAAFAAFFRIFTEALPGLAPSWEIILSVIAIVTMFVGNLGAIMQTNIKRLLAYSSISHAGYIMIAIIAGSTLGSSALVFYMLAYSFMTFGAFGVVILLGRKGNENLELEDYSGLGFKAPLLALCMSIFLLSLGGLPPFAGFVAKFYIFQAALNEGYVTLVVLAVLNSAISFYYYLRVIVYMYMKEPQGEFQISMTPLTVLVILIGVLGTVELGLLPDSVLSLASP